MSRRRRGKRNLHLHQHTHHHQSHAQSLTIKQTHLSPRQTLVNAPVRFHSMTRNQTFAPTVTPMPMPPIVQQKSDDSFAAFITGVLSAIVVAASLLGNHAGSPRRK